MGILQGEQRQVFQELAGRCISVDFGMRSVPEFSQATIKTHGLLASCESSPRQHQHCRKALQRIAGFGVGKRRQQR